MFVVFVGPRCMHFCGASGSRCVSMCWFGRMPSVREALFSLSLSLSLCLLFSSFSFFLSSICLFPAPPPPLRLFSSNEKERGEGERQQPRPSHPGLPQYWACTDLMFSVAAWSDLLRDLVWSVPRQVACDRVVVVHAYAHAHAHAHARAVADGHRRRSGWMLVRAQSLAGPNAAPHLCAAPAL